MNEQEEFEQDMMNEMEDVQAFDQADADEDRQLSQDDFQDAYGSPGLEEKQNAHTFIHRAAFESEDTVKTTFLSESELGRPLFNIRFLLDIEDICKFYMDDLIAEIGLDPHIDNKIAGYFKEKIRNTSDSGMSNKGFAMNLNVTRKMDTTRRRGGGGGEGNINNLMKGGTRP